MKTLREVDCSGGEREQDLNLELAVVHPPHHSALPKSTRTRGVLIRLSSRQKP